MSEPVPFDLSDEAALKVANDPVIQHLMKNVDRDAIRENLKLTPEQRLAKLERICQEAEARGEWPKESFEFKDAAVSSYGSSSVQTEPVENSVFPFDPVIEAFKRDVDRTLLRETLKLTPTERALQLEAMNEFIEELQRAGAKMRAEDNT